MTNSSQPPHSPAGADHRLAGDAAVLRREESASTFLLFSGVGLAIGGTFLFALKSVFIKLAFAQGTNATTLLALRMDLSLPFYLAMLWRLRREVEPGRTREARHALAAMLLGFFGYYLASFLDMAGLALVSAQLERLTLFTYPALIALLAWLFLDEKLNAKIVAAICLSYLGIYLMYSQERGSGSAANVLTGVLLVLGSALSYSLYVLLAKPLMQRMGSRRFTSLAMVGSAFFVTVHFLATQPVRTLGSLPLAVWLYGLILASVCTVIPSFMINEAILRVGAARTTVIGSIGPVLTMILAIVVLGEPASLVRFAGMAIVLAGVSLVAAK